MNETEAIYPCVGICTPDPDSGYCLGCGRPPAVSIRSEIDAVVTIERTKGVADGITPRPPSVASLDTPD